MLRLGLLAGERRVTDRYPQSDCRRKVLDGKQVEPASAYPESGWVPRLLRSDWELTRE
jgi:hypothetical protein